MKTCTKTKGGGNRTCGQCPNDVNICISGSPENGVCEYYQDIYTQQDIEYAIDETLRLKFNNSTKISNFVHFGSKKTDWMSDDKIKSEVLKKT